MDKLYTASIVIYKTPYSMIYELINTIIASSDKMVLFIIDNSPEINDKFLLKNERIVLKRNQKNIGFGAAHNIALKEALERGTLFHFIINPDIKLDQKVISEMIESMRQDASIGLMMPKILNIDGSVQYLPKLLPTPFSIIFRKLNLQLSFFTTYMKKYELRDMLSDSINDVAIVSGCFSLIRREVIESVGLFDERYFLYFEDWDLSRRVAMKYRTVINNSISVVHEYNSEANKSIKLFFIFIKSALSYFFKWGFFFDHDSKLINQKVLRSIKNV